MALRHSLILGAFFLCFVMILGFVVRVFGMWSNVYRKNSVKCFHSQSDYKWYLIWQIWKCNLSVIHSGHPDTINSRAVVLFLHHWTVSVSPAQPPFVWPLYVHAATWNCSGGSREEDKNVKNLQRHRQWRITNKFRSKQLTWANCQKDKCVYKCQNKEDTYQDQSVEFDLVIRSCQRNVIRHFGSSYCYNDKFIIYPSNVI